MSKHLSLAFIMFCLLSSSGVSQSFSDIVMNADDTHGFVLRNQGDFFIDIAPGRRIETLVQSWGKPGQENDYVWVNYGIFATSRDAYQGMVFSKGNGSMPSGYGSPSGSIIGDHSWFPNPGYSVDFVRGNVGIQMQVFESDKMIRLSVMEELSRVILDKIEQHLPPETLESEARAADSQVSLEWYEEMIGGLATAGLSQGYSASTIKNSPWFLESGAFVLGRRTEWHNDQGIVIGIDIAQCEGNDAAENALRVRLKDTRYIISDEPISWFDMHSPDSVDSLADVWTMAQFRPALLMGISRKGRYTVHVYQYAPTGLDTAPFTDVLKLISSRLSSVASSVNEEDAFTEISRVFTLAQNIPNPFNPSTVIGFSLACPARVRLGVYDADGRKVRELASRNYPAGIHSVTWDGRDDAGNPVASGVYISRMEAQGRVEARKMLLVR